MPGFTLSKSIAASPDVAFAVASDFDALPNRIPEIKKIERLTPDPIGVGTKFRETRIMFGREAVETFEVTEFEPGRRFVMVAISCGMEYWTEHRFLPDGSGTRMELELRFRALTFIAKLMAPLGWLMSGTMKKAIAKDLDTLAAAVERAAV